MSGGTVANDTMGTTATATMEKGALAGGNATLAGSATEGAIAVHCVAEEVVAVVDADAAAGWIAVAVGGVTKELLIMAKVAAVVEKLEEVVGKDSCAIGEMVAAIWIEGVVLTKLRRKSKE